MGLFFPQNALSQPHVQESTSQVSAYLEIQQAFYEARNLDSAEWYLHRALELAEEGGQVEMLTSIYTYLGRLKLDQDQLANSLSWFQKVLEVHIQDKNYLKQAACLSNMSIIFHRQSDFHKAIEHLEQSLRLYQEHLDTTHINLGYTYSNLGDNFYLLTAYDEALQYYLQALKIKSQFLPGSDQSLLINLNNIASCYLRQEKIDTAEQYIIRSLQHESLVPYDWAIADAWRISGQISLKKKEYSTALESFQKSLTLLRHSYGQHHYWVAHGYVEIGKFYTNIHEYDSALSYLQRALMVYDSSFHDASILANPRLTQGDLLYYLIEILLPKAASLYQRSTESFRNRKYYLEALHTHEVLIDAIDRLQASYVGESSLLDLQKQLRPVYEQAVELAFGLFEMEGEQKYLEQAFQLSEKGKGLGLLQALLKAEAVNGHILPDSIRDKEQQLEFEIQELERKILDLPIDSAYSKDRLKNHLFELNRIKDSLHMDIAAKFPTYYGWKLAGGNLDLSQIRDNLLRQDEALISYLLGPGYLFCFVLSKDRFQGYKTPISPDLKQNIYKLRESIEHQTDDFSTLAFDLYQLLLAPVEQLYSFKHLLIVPDGNLYALPFEVLLTQETHKLDYSQYPYLLRSFSCRYAISIRVAMHHQDALSHPARFKGFAPGFPRDDEIPPLPGAEKEIASIHEQMGGKVYLGAKATESCFRTTLKKGDIVHLATHAISRKGSANRSHLLFAEDDQTGKEDGRLFAYELYRMRLQAGLVILSACNTGMGEILEGEGTMSLARGFVYAGSPNIVMTLWAVPDLSGLQMMVPFYEGLQQELPIDLALHKAKLAYLNQADEISGKPIFWAGYVYMGQSKGIIWGNSPGEHWYLIIFLGLILLLAGRFALKAIRSQRSDDS